MDAGRAESRFVGRRREIELLERAYDSAESAFVPIHGRRRVGKSELIRRLMRSRPGLYFVGKMAPPELQLREFLREAAHALSEPLLESLPPRDWKRALIEIESRWKGSGKLILALDEFQWTAGASPELPSVLQECWDTRWRDSGKVLLILCGSYVGFMEREVLGARSPLFGRRTAQILLRPFSYLESAEFHPKWSLEDRARAHFVCGGVPLYLRHFDASQSVEQNLTRTLLEEEGPLFREPDLLLREELREVERYYAVLLAIAAGNHTVAKIANRAGLPERGIGYHLQQLTDLGYVQRRYPLTRRKPAARSVTFFLKDPLLRFWFRFVFPNLSYARLRPRDAFTTRVRPQLDSYFGACFEELCREALPRIYEREGVEAAFEVGEYWDKLTQIDVVGVRDDNWTDVGECKWGTVRSARRLTQELDDKVSHYPNRAGASIGRRLFVRRLPAGASSDRNRTWHDLRDLYR